MIAFPKIAKPGFRNSQGYTLKLGAYKSKKYNRLWAVSLLIIVIVTIVVAESNMMGTKLPDIVIRILGVIDIIAIPILVFASVKKKEHRQ